jgi:hypothetical protein
MDWLWITAGYLMYMLGFYFTAMFYIHSATSGNRFWVNMLVGYFWHVVTLVGYRILIEMGVCW